LALLKPFRDSIYKQSINTIIKLGGTVVEYEPEPMSFDGFGTILTADMKVDLLII
jgi:amidase